MEYYILKEACANKDTGPVYPQIQKWKPGYNEDAPYSYYSYYNASSKGQLLPDFEPDLDALVMHGRANITDLISSGLSIGFIISQRLKVIFEKFKFPPYRFYAAKIIHKKAELNDYYLMYVISNHYEDHLDSVDYESSVFFTAGISQDNIEPINLTSKNDYLEKANRLQEEFKLTKTLRSIYAKEIHFNSNFDKSLDCFIAPFGTDYYISYGLKKALTEKGITGLDLKLAENIEFRP